MCSRGLCESDILWMSGLCISSSCPPPGNVKKYDVKRLRSFSYFGSRIEVLLVEGAHPFDVHRPNRDMVKPHYIHLSHGPLELEEPEISHQSLPSLYSADRLLQQRCPESSRCMLATSARTGAATARPPRQSFLHRSRGPYGLVRSGIERCSSSVTVAGFHGAEVPAHQPAPYERSPRFGQSTLWPQQQLRLVVLRSAGGHTRPARLRGNRG
jgi:hypothetical protein